MSFTILSKYGINIGADQWAFTINGDPTSGAGLKAAIGSICVQLDSSPANLFWDKTGPLQTDWSALSASGSAGVSAAASSTGAYRASSYNVPIDGIVDAAAAMATLTGTTMPQTGGPYGVIIGPGEVLNFANDATIPKNAFIQGTGGVIKPASGKVVTLSAQPTGNAKMFDISAGGFVISNVPATSRPEWWGADNTGASNASPAVNHALAFLTGQKYGTVSNTPIGGKMYIKSGTYRLDDYGLQFGDAYGLITVEGDGPGTLLKNGTSHGSNTFTGMFSFYGDANFALKQMRFKSFRMSGAGAGDYTRHMVIDQAEDLHFEDITIENNACEGIVSITGEAALRKVSFINCRAYNVGMATGLAAFNLNAQNVLVTHCIFDTCGNGFENEGHFSQVSNCQFINMGFYGVMLQSTWSGYLDASFNQVNTFGGQVNNCTFSNYNGRGVTLPDFTGHANGSYPTHGPAQLDGGLGKIMVTSNLFDRLGIGVWGGSDKVGEIECSSNIFSGQYDAGTGSQTVALCPQGGTWNIHHNTFTKGSGLAWVGLIGINQVTTGKPDRMSIVDNIVVNKCWGSGQAIRTYQDTTIKGTRFLDLDGSIAAAPTAVLYRVSDPADASRQICNLLVSEWAWQDPNHQICMGSEPTILPVNGNSLPANISFKPGDVLVNRGTSASVGWFNKKCVTGGTFNSTPLSTCTATGTSGTKLLTLATPDAVMTQYSWIYFPAIPAISPKRIMNSPATNTTVTLDSNLEATVPAGTVVAFATPTWITDRDANSLTIASQATGDMLYASSATNFTRLPAGTAGQFLSGGTSPAWVDSYARVDAGNSSTAITITRTAAAQEQKVTLTAATPAITIAGVPSGGYLILDVFQDATGGRIPTFTTAISGGLVWANGNTAPTITPTASVSDRLLFHNDGTRLIGSVVWQNT